ncbi:PREDICTED: malignant fibrous histiocytoma-amplified sequence 1 homolog [Branchiostoma belcheri]|uniref:Malignant fibrous histiocytoma-amplified sequence 1 homolog n=1 Tax=Branchiostoma belcheri TaxID=7741 RepID=A0A6P5AJJ4_BRABE|nr:PREDICTED: malignant fibrous histiocytoma-amplified sequence 1 homolog [Branchiostoma belcheri]
MANKKLVKMKEKLFQNGQAYWRDAEFYRDDMNSVEKLEFPDCSFEWKPLTDGTYSLTMKSKDPPCFPDFLRSDSRTEKVSQLHLSVNRMKKIPAGISIFSQVTDVKLDRNKLRKLTPEFTQLKKIKNLDLGNNDFRKFPDEIKEFHDLEVLRFSVNQVEEIPSGVFPRLPKLKNLRIGSNKLKSLPEDLAQLENLEYLKISSNKFSSFPPQLLQLPSIRQVCISANKITEVPLEFFDKPLELFQAEDNPLSEPPQEVCIQGVAAIKQYCQSLKTEDVIEDLRIKLMLLGDTGAGKTSLCMSLKTGQPYLVDIQNRTHGIDRHDITEGDVTFLTWDFAGQQDYLVTHPVFITKDALVLLVVNLERYRLNDEDSYRREVGVWIDNIAMRVPDATVLPVGTHLDKITPEDAQEKLDEIFHKIKKEQEQRLKTVKRHIAQLKRRLDQPSGGTDTGVLMHLLTNLEEKQGLQLQVQEGIALSSKGLEGFTDFRRTVAELAQKHLQQARRKIPATWRQVEDLMKPAEKENGPGVISIDDAVEEILHGTKVTTSEEAKVILGYLHGLGLLIWYSEIDCLKTYVFKDPAALVSVFKVVIRDRLQEELSSITKDQMGDEGMTAAKFKVQLKKFTRKALLDHRILSILWKKAKLNEMLNVEEDEKLLVDVLEQFQLCFTHTPAEPDALNPDATEFHPGSPWTPPGNKAQPTPDQLRRSTLYLFPCYLHDSLPAEEWFDPCPPEQEQIRVGLTFFPEVPYGFFERLCVCLHQLSPGLRLWRNSAKLAQNNVSSVIRKHRGQHGDSTVNDLQGIWNDPTIEMVARGNKSDPESCREMLWDPVLRVLGVAQSLLSLWPGVNIDMFSLCPDCEPGDAEMFEVPLPVNLESDQGQTAYCEACEKPVPRALVYPVGTANPDAETQSRYPLVNNKSYFYTYNFHGSPLTNCQVGNRNNQVLSSTTQGGSAGGATGGTTPPPAAMYRGGATTPPGYANRGGTSPDPSANRGGATAGMASPPFPTCPQLQPQYNPVTALGGGEWYSQQLSPPYYNQPASYYNQPPSLAPRGTYNSQSGGSTYNSQSGGSTYNSQSGGSTYNSQSGVSTYNSQSGGSTYNSQSGVSTYNSQSGVSTYNSQSGVSTYNSQSVSSTTRPKTVGSESPAPFQDAGPYNSAETQPKQLGPSSETRPKLLK